MHALPDPLPGRLLVLIAPNAAVEAMLELAARLAQHGPLQVLDGGNHFNAYKLARLLRRIDAQEPSVSMFERDMQRVFVSRAFTCFQVLTLLEQAPSGSTPLLALDLLATFYDESVLLAERRRLARLCVEHLRRLSLQAAVVASLRPPPPPRIDPTGLLDIVRQAADVTWIQEIPIPPTTPRLL